ncbi:MAG: DUF4340 domain-containing protein [Gemmatimonadota bacterium]|nr:DUF4340 domain-containing protein [Gemmatimonadota bacterium]
MNRLIKPLIILAVLVAIALAVHYTGTDRSRPDAEISFRIALDSTAVERVEISRQDAQVTLLKGSQGWTVKTPFGIKPADEEAITSAISSLVQISQAELVSHNPDKQAEYRTDDASGTRVKFIGAGDKVLEDLIVGKLGGFEQQQRMMAMGGQPGQFDPQSFHTYMRPAGSGRVFKVPGFFASITGADPDQWRDHVICSFPASKAVRLTLASGDRITVLEPDTAGLWEVAGDQRAPADSMTVAAMLRSLGSFRAESFQDSALTDEELGLDKPSFQMAAELEDGTRVEVEIGKEYQDDYFYARRVGAGQVYRLPRYRLEQIMKNRTEILTGKKEGEE